MVFLTQAKEHLFIQVAGKKSVAHFNTSQRMPHEPESLFSIYQQDRELLKDFVARLKVVMLNIYHLDELVAMLAMKTGLAK